VEAAIEAPRLFAVLPRLRHWTLLQQTDGFGGQIQSFWINCNMRSDTATFSIGAIDFRLRRG
jgi:hypothetical protein